MKIKSDFITNSSSTSYVICLPDKISDELMESLFTKVSEESEEEPSEDRKKEILKMIRKLEKGDQLWKEEDFSLYYGLVKLAEEQEWIIDEKETGPDAGLITVLTKKNLLKIRKIKEI